jgi:predicted nucleic acid-binding protein
MADKLFLDTSALYAHFDKSDSAHKKISSFLDGSEDIFYTSDYIIDELITLLRYRNFAIEQIKIFIDALWEEKFSYLLNVCSDTRREAWKMMKKYKDHKLSFTDCTSFILMRHHFINKACSIDEHFKIPGFIVLP